MSADDLFELLWFDFEPVVVAGEGPRVAERAAADRAVARVLARLGCAERSIVRHSTGRPRWPAGVVGSIAHTHTRAVVTAARAGTIDAVGVDLEVAGALDPSDAAYVLTGEEKRFVTAHGEPAALATALWCAKEAAFKAWCGWADDALDGTDPLDITIAARGHRFDAAATGPLAGLPRLMGRWSNAGSGHKGDDLLLAVALLPGQSTASVPMPVSTSRARAASPSM